MMPSPGMQIVGNILTQARLSCIYLVEIKLHAFFPGVLYFQKVVLFERYGNLKHLTYLTISLGRVADGGSNPRGQQSTNIAFTSLIIQLLSKKARFYC